MRLRDPKLSSVLRYKNDAVVRRFATDYGLALATSRRLFVEMLTFLWIANKHLVHLRNTAVGRDREKTFDVLSIWYGLDEMWHTFILFSLDYEAFCYTHFGRYIHHQPAADLPSRSRGRPEHRRDRPHLSLEDYVQFTYETLGRATVVRWFKTYPRTMSRHVLIHRRIASLRKQLARDPDAVRRQASR